MQLLLWFLSIVYVLPCLNLKNPFKIYDSDNSAYFCGSNIFSRATSYQKPEQTSLSSNVSSITSAILWTWSIVEWLSLKSNWWFSVKFHPFMRGFRSIFSYIFYSIGNRETDLYDATSWFRNRHESYFPINISMPGDFFRSIFVFTLCTVFNSAVIVLHPHDLDLYLQLFAW